MIPIRLTILRLMAAIALFGMNAGLGRAFLVQEMFFGAIPIFFALQFGVWRASRTQGRIRRFWMGFVGTGLASVLMLFAVDIFPDSVVGRLVQTYTNAAFNFSQQYLPTALDDLVMEQQAVFLVIIYFLPELLAALFGGLILTCFPTTLRAFAKARDKKGDTWPVIAARR